MVTVVWTQEDNRLPALASNGNFVVLAALVDFDNTASLAVH
jgi:hypothetical protein